MIGNALSLALRSIRRNVLRSTLTMLGIVIGIASVVSMVNLGRGATLQITERMQSLGNNLLTVRPGQQMAAGQRGEARAFTLEDVEALGREVDGVAAVAPSSGRPLVAVYGNQSWSTTLIGSDNRYLVVRGWSIAEGRELFDGELRAGKASCLIGATVKRELFAEQPAVGSTVRLGKIACVVVGVMTSKGQSTMGTDMDDFVLMPMRAFFRRISGTQDVTTIQISARDDVVTEDVKRDVEVLLRKRRRIGPAEDDDFSVLDMKQFTTIMAGTTKALTGLLGTIAAVSLIVGGIGIMNIMLVSVTERTREIGIRLAIGALEREVMLQFLVEAVVLSSLGGVFGILLALAASVGLASSMEVPLVFDPDIVGIAVLFAAGVGIVFGFFPARKAAQLDPIEALRHE